MVVYLDNLGKIWYNYIYMYKFDETLLSTSLAWLFFERIAVMTYEHTGTSEKKGGFFKNCRTLSPSQNKVLNIFFYSIFAGTAMAMLGIILYYVYAFASLYHGNESFNWLLDIFSDFVSIMNAALADSPYLLEDGASYPAVAIIVLYPFALICKGVFASYSHLGAVTVDELTSYVIRHKEFWIALVLFFLICISSILLIIIKKYKLNPVASLKAGILIMMSAPFVYAIMRGNTIYFALVFLLLFLLLYDNPRPWAREIAYICLALAGCIKIYPLFFGVFLLKKKKFFASFRVAAYFLAISLVSFYFFPAGMGDFDVFLENLGGFMSDTKRLLSLRNLSVPSMLYKVFYLISPALADSAVYTVVNWSILIAIFVAASVTAIVTRSHFSRSVIASAVVILVPSISYFYVLIFAAIPFMEYLIGYDSFPAWKQKLYGFFFMFLFFTFFLLPQCFVPHGIVMIIMMILEERTVIKEEILPYLKNCRTAKSAT